MKLFLSLFLLSLDVSTAFTSPSSHSIFTTTTTTNNNNNNNHNHVGVLLVPVVGRVAATTTHIILQATPAEDAPESEYDDWYNDFDPSEFENAAAAATASTTTTATTSTQHDYERDISADNSNVDLEEVNYLLAERLVMKKSRRFDEADAIRDELLDKHGVMVRDKEGTWRTGCSRSGSGKKWGDDQRRPRKAKDFGPNGHDYNMAPDAGPIQSSLSEAEIHEMLAERLQYKLKRDYPNADRIQAALLSAGVQLNDRRKLWRADGAPFEEFASRKYSQSQHSQAVDTAANAEQIQAMVDERSKAKSERLYQRADELRDALLNDFDVHIDDKRAEWSVGGEFGVVVAPTKRDRFTPFVKAPGCPVTEHDSEIQQMLDDRDAARADRDFVTADDLRQKLLEMSVYIDDRKREWSMRGVQRGFNRREGGEELSEETLAGITSLLEARSEHKKNRKFKSADKIRDQLRDEFNVLVDDKKREWFTISAADYTMSANSAPIDDETAGIVTKLLEKRVIAKIQRDYKTADSIRDMLVEKFGVTVDDRVKEWERLGEVPAATTTAAAAADEGVVAEGGGDSVEESTSEAPVQEEAVVLPSESTTMEAEEEDLEQMTIPMLKDKLREMELPVGGNKAELVQRILGEE